MKILSDKPVILLGVFIVVCLYFGKDWSAQDLPVFDGEPNQLTADLEQPKVSLKDESDISSVVRIKSEGIRGI